MRREEIDELAIELDVPQALEPVLQRLDDEAVDSSTQQHHLLGSLVEQH